MACRAPGEPPPAHDEPHKEPVLHPAPDRVAPEPLPTDVAVRYALDLSAAAQHRVAIEATAAPSAATQVWMMPTWVPGSYLVREFARQIETIDAVDQDGGALAIRKVAKNRWEVQVDGAEAVTVRYLLYAHELAVQTDFIDADLAVLNGGATFMTPIDQLDAAHGVSLDLPEGWASETGMDPWPGQADHAYLARDFDELVDSPLVLGSALQAQDFTVGGVTHRLVHSGADGEWDLEANVADLEELVAAQVAFWGVVPYARYVFLNVIRERASGGLEHLDSTLMMVPRARGSDEDGYKRWLGLVSHEFFHTWNVKRLKPVGLGPFDYEHEVYTESLWFAEGLTSYYDDLLLVRAGLLDGDDHLSRLSSSIQRLERRPGADRQSVAQASFDAWIKHYRQDENSPNHTVSYYLKGSLVGWLLDTAIRERSGDRRSLDDALRRMYAEHPDGFTPADVRAALSWAAGVSMDDLFDRYVEGTVPLDYAAPLAWWGLRFKAVEEEEEAWLGLDASGSPWTVDRVARNTPAYEAGIELDDEIIAVGEHRVGAGTWRRVLDRYAPGDPIVLTIARDGRIRRVNAVLGQTPRSDWTLEVDPLSTTKATLRRERWWNAR